jgi:hypothetical protein
MRRLSIEKKSNREKEGHLDMTKRREGGVKEGKTVKDKVEGFSLIVIG